MHQSCSLLLDHPRGRSAQTTLPRMSDVSVERDIAAPPEKVWALISDVTRMGEWSPEARDGEWIKGATAPAVDARFKGRNARGRVRGRPIVASPNASRGARSRSRCTPVRSQFPTGPTSSRRPPPAVMWWRAGRTPAARSSHFLGRMITGVTRPHEPQPRRHGTDARRLGRRRRVTADVAPRGHRDGHRRALQELAQRAEQRGNRSLAGGVAHEPDAPRLAGELAEPAADLDAVLSSKRLRSAASSAPSGNHADVSCGSRAPRCDQREAQLGERGLQRGADGPVAGPHRRAALVEHRAEPGVQRHDHPDRRGVVVLRARCPRSRR